MNTTPNTQILTNNMWLTDNLTDQGVNGVYQALRLGIRLYEFDSYVTMQGRDNSALTNGNATSSTGIFSNTWQNLYEGVQRANNALYGIVNISPTEETKKGRLIAEVKFLRAFYYYRLNQLFKGVPIYTEPIVWNGATLPRNSEQEVWTFILNDLADCIAEVNLPDRYPAASANYGRITKSAAYALRGKVYMYLSDWQSAIQDFRIVQELGHTLFPSYQELFLDVNEQAPEIIFSIQNAPIPGYGSDYQFTFGSRTAFGSNWNTYLVHPDLVDLYQMADGSPFSWNDHIAGYNEMTPAQREIYFLRNNLTDGERTAAQNRQLNLSLYLPTQNEERIRRAYTNRDPRLAANVILPYATFLGDNAGSDQVFTNRWPFRQDLGIGSPFDLRTDIVARFYYLPRKFVYTGGNPPIPDRTSGGYDYIVMRYADILLLWSEALNELGQVTNAIAKINEVRARAGVGLLDNSWHQASLRDEIRDERRREFMGEGVIFFDEMRWQTLRQTTFYEGNGIKEVWGTRIAPYNWVGDQLYAWPIPRVELDLNTSLQQNPGWID
ncbi:RagB/SusD family nutrient uptake outer membrane protein [Sphingobacterium corticibacter]|uniref:RagB/SusD family nutrient uptake outer membrane protein n=1 Tax=Sphingobacterium corticibacter TaxID=2171749 RepID=UPI0037434E4C